MNIFSEIYGAYYRIVAKILEERSVTPARMNELIRKYGFRDSVLFLPPKIDPRSGENWGLLRSEGGVFKAVTKNPPPKIVTALQKRWLKAILADPKIRLFMDDDTIARLEKRLEGVQSLFRSEHFYIPDRYSDGDKCDSESYRSVFRTILTAAREKNMVEVTYRSRKGAVKRLILLPVKIEYSHKDDKFRLYAVQRKQGRLKEGCILNIGRIISAENTGITEDITVPLDNLRSFRRCDEPVEVHIAAERNAMERFLMEFASYEKQTELDDDGSGCTVRLWYDRPDEAEMLIRLLSYGAALEILSPPSLRHAAAARVHRQYRLLSSGGKNF